MTGFAFRGRAEYRGHIVLAFDVRFRSEVQITTIGLRFAGERVLQIVQRLALLQIDGVFTSL